MLLVQTQYCLFILLQEPGEKVVDREVECDCTSLNSSVGGAYRVFGYLGSEVISQQRGGGTKRSENDGSQGYVR